MFVCFEMQLGNNSYSFSITPIVGWIESVFCCVDVCFVFRHCPCCGDILERLGALAPLKLMEPVGPLERLGPLEPLQPLEPLHPLGPLDTLAPPLGQRPRNLEETRERVTRTNGRKNQGQGI